VTRQISNPHILARALALLEEQMRELGFTAHYEEDFAAFSRIRRELRSAPEAPLFDAAATTLPPERAFWMSVTDKDGKIRALQAFRLDLADPDLGEWALGWVLGIYLKRNELIIPAALEPSETSISRRISGPVVYHGELWVDRKVRARRLVELFSKLGMLLAVVKWRPRAIWALIGNAMATRGHMIRMGYVRMEPGFMRWQFVPEAADTNEWLGLAEMEALEQLAEEIVAEAGD
jgi:hypothetical protein